MVRARCARRRDIIDFDAGYEPPSGAAVTLSLGDSDTASVTGDTSDTSTEAQSPATGDTTDADHDDNPLSPILMMRHGPTAAYRSRSHQRQRRRHRWTLRAVIAIGTLTIPLLFTLAVAARLRQPVNIPVIYLSTVATCLTCWALAIITRAVLSRGRYRARHSPKACAATRAATFTGTSTPPPALLDTPAEPSTGPGTDHEETQILRPAIPQEPVPVEPNLQIRAQQLAQALSGRQGLGTGPDRRAAHRPGRAHPGGDPARRAGRTGGPARRDQGAAAALPRPARPARRRRGRPGRRDAAGHQGGAGLGRRPGSRLPGPRPHPGRRHRRVPAGGGHPMSERSSIEWTDTTWNPTTGCAITSARRAQFRPQPARDEFRLEIVTDPDVAGAVVRFHADGIAAALAQARRLLAAHDGPADTYGELYQRNGDLADFLTTIHQGA